MKNQTAHILHQIPQRLGACSCLLAACIALSAPQVRAENTEFPIADGITAQITQNGALKEITVEEVPVVAEKTAGGLLVGTPVDAQDADSRLYQSWGWLQPDKAKFEARQDKFSASGTIIPQSSSDPEQGCDFAIVYRKIRNGVLEISVEVTYTGAGLWNSPVSYFLYFPVAALGDASIKTLEANGSSEDYYVENEVAFKSPAAKDIKIHTAAWTVDVKADGKSQMSLDDSRRWGGDAIVIALVNRDSSEKPVEIEKGQKVVYSATLEFRKK